MVQKRDRNVEAPHFGPVHAFAGHCQSEEATGALAKINLHTPDIPWSVQICLPSVCDLVASLRSARSPNADNDDSSAGVCRLKAPVASPDRRRPAGTQVSTRTLSATLTSIADL